MSISVGVHHIDGPSMRVIKIRVEDVILRLNRSDAQTMASALIHDVNECGYDVRSETKEWHISRWELAVTIYPEWGKDQWPSRDPIRLVKQLTDNWRPGSWQALVVNLLEFAQ